MRLGLGLFLLPLAAAAMPDRATLQYLEILDDNGLYVGQAASDYQDSGGADKAEMAATARARAALAEAIELRIQSRVTDRIQGNAQAVTEKTEALSASESDLKLANVKT